MKTLLCRELGGTCDTELKADSWQDMVQAMTEHVMKNHPVVAQEMEEMYKQNPKKWGSEMKPKWDAAPES
jgi:predicted small metal-binding protein